MVNLLKEWRRIKHSPQYENRDDRKDAAISFMQRRASPSAYVIRNPHVTAGMGRLIRHGVLLANVHPDFFDNFAGGWSAHPDRYHFLGTAKKWLEVMHRMNTDSIRRNGDLQPYLKQLGYVYLFGRVTKAGDVVVGYGGTAISREIAVETFAGWTYPAQRVEITALPKHHQAKARAWAATHPADEEDCVLAPVALIDQDKLVYENNAWRRPAAPKPFVIERIGGYHSSARHLKSLDHLSAGIRLGLELELACPRPRRGSSVGVSAAKFLNKHVHPRYALVENDRSVTNGFELVVAPASVDFHKTKLLALADTWRRLGEKTNPFKRCYDTASCAGIHIHVDKRSVRNWAALSHFIGIKKLEGDYRDTWREALFGREAGYFCQEYKNRTEPNSKYSAINDIHNTTYEARVFASSNDPLEWIGHIEVMAAMVVWTNSMLMFNTKRLTVSEFLRFLFDNSDEYPRAYARGFELHRRETLKRIDKADKDGALLESLEVEHA